MGDAADDVNDLAFAEELEDVFHRASKANTLGVHMDMWKTISRAFGTPWVSRVGACRKKLDEARSALRNGQNPKFVMKMLDELAELLESSSKKKGKTP